MKKMTKSEMKKLAGGNGNTCAFCTGSAPDGPYSSCWYMSNPSLTGALNLCLSVYPNSPSGSATLGPCTKSCVMKAEVEPISGELG